jgi:hypothetical protein
MADPVASIGDVMQVLFACQAKNMKWSEKSRGLLATVLQRQTCHSVNNIVLGIARLPLPLKPSEQTFTMSEPPKVFYSERRHSIHEEEPLAKRV